MKKVLILFGRSNWKKSKPFGNKKYLYSYEYFYELCKKQGMQIYRASYQWYNHDNKKFDNAWTFEGKNKQWKRVSDIKPDLIFDKTKATPEAYYEKEKIAKEYSFLNDLHFTKLIDNKLYTGLLFPKWSKGNLLTKNVRELEIALENIKSETVVLKPLEESGGRGIIIDKKDEILRLTKKNNFVFTPYIVQEFINTSAGIPAVMKGVHDLRLVFINDMLVYSYYRQPAKEKLLANLVQGGRMEIVSLEKLPRELDPIISFTHNIFSPFPSKIFTVDIMFDEMQKPWIVELNSMPGMYFEPGQEKIRRHFYQKLLEVIRNECVNQI
ncbi:MAG: hypothetical protein U9O20_04325 [Patescibacteria group bacterium]|nr:hypothetical protein [Patescibacteria group bacterium]